MEYLTYFTCPVSQEEIEVHLIQRTANGFGVSDGVVVVDEIGNDSGKVTAPGWMTVNCPCQHDGCETSVWVAADGAVYF